MERRLIKTGSTEEFIKQLQDNIDSGGIQAYSRGKRRISRPCELHHHGGGVQDRNVYHDPLKNLCEQQHENALLADVSLNNSLLKGPHALQDLYMVTLGIQEHRVAFTKGISKFYQCTEADEWHNICEGSCGNLAILSVSLRCS